ncbi:hypothetical protein GW916_06220 [bacterium]|nr:hypothetical protein [bacterium]
MRVIETFLIAGVLLFGDLSFSSEIVKISDQDVSVEDVAYRSGRGPSILHSAQLSQPTEIHFSRGNKMDFSKKIFFHENQSIWMAEASVGPSLVSWTLPSGLSILLDCGQEEMNSGLIVPQKHIRFHENGEYHSGCRTQSDTPLLTASGDSIYPLPLSHLDLTERGELKYVRVKSGKLNLNGQEVSLASGAEINFHPNGKLDFFNMKQGEVFKIHTEQLGWLWIRQSEALKITRFGSDGRLEAGVLGDELNLGAIVLPQGSAVSFDQPASNDLGLNGPREWSALLPAEQQLELDGYLEIWISQVRFDSDDMMIGVVNSRPFIFHPPKGESFEVPIGSRIHVNVFKKILKIELPQ